MQQTEEQKELGPAGQINLAVALLVCLADPVLPYLRRPGSWGDRFLSIYTALSVGFMFLFIAEFGDPAAFAAFYLTCFMFLVHRLARRRSPGAGHSRSGGISWFRGKHACTMKEPATVALAGLACLASGLSVGLGYYLLLAALGLSLGQAQYEMRINSRVRQMIDSRIETEVVRASYEDHIRRNP